MSSTRRDPERILTCSFCGKTSDQVKKVIVMGALGICDACVSTCVAIIEECAANEGTP